MMRRRRTGSAAPQGRAMPGDPAAEAAELVGENRRVRLPTILGSKLLSTLTYVGPF